MKIYFGKVEFVLKTVIILFLSFGTRPAELIDRPVQASDITESFLSEYETKERS